MRARVDQVKCDTSGICVARCPELFRFRPGDKKAEVTRDPVPPKMEKRCRAIAKQCPRRAIIVDET
jgi:ferredoxin